jgi:hypothetical protein
MVASITGADQVRVLINRQPDMSTGPRPALYSSMNWSVALPPEAKRTSLSVTGSTLRIRCWLTSAPPFHAARKLRKPIVARAGAVTSNLARTEAPAATAANAAGPVGRAVQPAGSETVRRTFSIAAALVLTKLVVRSFTALGVKLVSRVWVRRATSYFAATILACTLSATPSPGWPAVITPS